MRQFKPIFILFLIFIDSSCLNLKDENQIKIIYQKNDYEGIRDAILFIKSGGATVGDSYQISIVPNFTLLKKSDTGNIFICDYPNKRIPDDTSVVNLKWIGYDTLKITYKIGARIFKANTKNARCRNNL